MPVNILLSREQVDVATRELMDTGEDDGVTIARYVAKVQLQRIVRILQNHNIIGRLYGSRPVVFGLALSAKDWEWIAAGADETIGLDSETKGADSETKGALPETEGPDRENTSEEG
ncbi:hypothetical protein LCGC14_1254040 [marine sediment metagenome]|uniref:Uncharacterized protein n=1 Tax=marine sediment metagenome TaxID=412755 RepID=A0A0F9P639_9ZZZZ